MVVPLYHGVDDFVFFAWEESHGSAIDWRKSAGLTAVEVWDDDRLIWSGKWFEGGATQKEYLIGLADVIEVMKDFPAFILVDQGERDEDGNPIGYDVEDTTGIVLRYVLDDKHNTGRWILGEDARGMGQSEEIVDALMATGVLPSDEFYEDRMRRRDVKEFVDFFCAKKETGTSFSSPSF